MVRHREVDILQMVRGHGDGGKEEEGQRRHKRE